MRSRPWALRSKPFGVKLQSSYRTQKGSIKGGVRHATIVSTDLLHLVFSTKDRRPYLQDRAIREELHNYLGGTCNQLDCPVLRVGGVADHVHILCRLGRTIAVADLIKELKRESSKWIKTKAQVVEDFYWQNGYGAFSISPAHVEAVRAYTVTFQDEFRRLLTKYGLEWDERYVWD